jgi:ABC-2 type transport system permease protein
MTQPIQLTGMEKILGRYYKWWCLLSFSIKSGLTYLISDALWIFGKVSSLIAIIAVWVVTETQNGPEMINYLIVGNIIFSITVVTYAWPINFDIRDGTISSILIVPTNVFMRYFVLTIFPTLRLGLIGALVILPLVFFFPEFVNFNANILLLIPFLFTAYIIRFFLELMIGFSAFWLRDAYGVIDSSIALQPLIAGSLIPFNLFGDTWWSLILQLNPLAFSFYHPMQIYLGNYNNQQILLTLLGCFSWCLVLYILTKVVFHLGMKKNESVGL